MVRDSVRQRLKAVRLSNCPAKLVTTKLKTTALENLRQELRNRFEGLELDDDTSPEDEW